ncbi:TVP38/TMEM64 family protein [Bacillus sp. FJAT-26390]|uniref:TVP38/TMEM64 family protein n=1 Tax=Bacillus sp. FJAT-26390 TaxID=1743142 RepID=UPI000807DD4C|nr:TVP38/TMEM64 family protein [Bacillus sp. FJAT-26390]OBZ17634.1 hypothetical protein A7975_07220 [Bacillus sp. FJAT-26390]
MSFSKWMIVFINIVLLLVMILKWNELIAWLREEEDVFFPLVFIIVVLLAAVPGVPFGLIGGIIGAKYGLLNGGIINLIASTSAAVLVYFLVRYLFKDMGMLWLENSKKLRRMDDFLRTRVFWSILLARLIPIMPAALINIYAGTFGLSFKIFLTATLLGKIPFILVFTYLGDSIQSGAMGSLVVIAVYGVFLMSVYLIYQLITKRQRI